MNNITTKKLVERMLNRWNFKNKMGRYKVKVDDTDNGAIIVIYVSDKTGKQWDVFELKTDINGNLDTHDAVVELLKAWEAGCDLKARNYLDYYTN